MAAGGLPPPPPLAAGVESSRSRASASRRCCSAASSRLRRSISLGSRRGAAALSELALDRLPLRRPVGDDPLLVGAGPLELGLALLDLGPKARTSPMIRASCSETRLDRVDPVEQVVEARGAEEDLERGLVAGRVEGDETLLQERLRLLEVRAAIWRRRSLTACSALISSSLIFAALKASTAFSRLASIDWICARTCSASASFAVTGGRWRAAA